MKQPADDALHSLARIDMLIENAQGMLAVVVGNRIAGKVSEHEAQRLIQLRKKAIRNLRQSRMKRLQKEAVHATRQGDDRKLERESVERSETGQERWT